MQLFITLRESIHSQYRRAGSWTYSKPKAGLRTYVKKMRLQAVEPAVRPKH